MSDEKLGPRLLYEKSSAPLPEIAEALHTTCGYLVLLGNSVSSSDTWNAKPAGGLGLVTLA